MKFLGIIPSRYNSTRFPGKPLVEINGKTMIRRVYEQALKSQKLDRVVVATDDLRIYDHVKDFGGEAFMTSSTHLNGTERCAELAERIEGYEAILNIQGDEPFIHEEQIDTLCGILTDASIGTLAKPIEDPDELLNPSVIKLVLNAKSEAIYFSRSPIPHMRGVPTDQWLAHSTYYRHIGLYGFRRELLLQLTKLAPTPLELAESLEQLRWLENGYPIKVGMTTHHSIGIDTPSDLEKTLQWS